MRRCNTVENIHKVISLDRETELSSSVDQANYTWKVPLVWSPKQVIVLIFIFLYFFCSRCSLERRKTFDFSSRHYTIGLRNTRHFFIQSELKPNQSQLVCTHFPALHVRCKNLPRMLIGSLDCRVHCDWPRQNDYFGFGFTTLIWKLL